MAMFAFFLILLCLCAGICPCTSDPGGVKCEGVQSKASTLPCVCRTPKGIIDLSMLASFNGTPRYTGLRDPSYYVFDFNPCATFTTSKECTGVYVCQKTVYRNKTIFVAIADKDTEQIRIREDIDVYLYYTGSDNRETYVHLTCDQSVTRAPIVETRGDFDVFLKYEVYNVTRPGVHVHSVKKAHFELEKYSISITCCQGVLGTKCGGVEGAPTCVCRTPQGVIDLTKIASFDGTPRFTGMQDPNHFIYDYNPCAPFTTPEGCVNPTHVCQRTVFNDSRELADYGTEQMYSKKDGHDPYVYYTGPGGRNSGSHRAIAVREGVLNWLLHQTT